jgi:hypothetical protein
MATHSSLKGGSGKEEALENHPKYQKVTRCVEMLNNIRNNLMSGDHNF